jgi:hypothetical protein
VIWRVDEMPRIFFLSSASEGMVTFSSPDIP